MDTIKLNKWEFFEFLGLYQYDQLQIRATFYGHANIFNGLFCLS